MLATLLSHAATVRADDAFESASSVLVRRCLECHNARESRGGLDLTTHAGLLRGGESGEIVDRDDWQRSLLLMRLVDGEMPPPRQGVTRRLPDEEVAAVRAWLKAGSAWPQGRELSLYDRTNDQRAGLDWWSLQPVRRPPLPTLPALSGPLADWAQSPIDVFIARRLAKDGLSPAPPASRRELVRRAYFDLWGLPPTAEQVEAFIADGREDAYERLVDQLLASPHYGERWARHWLDVVRFAETCGYERDQLKPGIWRYRDWVIDALNDDMPYDKFVTWQLAGDEIDSPTLESVVATGLIRAGTWNDEPNDPQDYLYERLEDMVHTTTTAFLGLTVKCARCHDHKFDPIPQTDYYRVASFFWAGYLGQANLGGPDAKQLGFDAFGWTDRGPQPPPIHLLAAGERSRPAEEVAPGFLSCVPGLDQPLSSPPAGARTTTRRKQFADWITSRDNPLTPRVIVNRLWLHHFGEGIVRTPNNFGFKSDPPTHPELLDWLAAELLAGDWRLKRIHRQLMLSATYRQSSAHPRHDRNAQVDFANRTWWRYNRRRLDAESLRDAMLHASGALSKHQGGPSFYPQMHPEALEGLSRKEKGWTPSPLSERSRRSIYMMTKRQRLLPWMTAFDFCDTSRPCGKRDVTTVAPQALALLNNHFTHAQSEQLAQRVRDAAPDDLQRQLRLAWRHALSRDPAPDELRLAAEHVRRQANRFASAIPSEPESEDLPARSQLSLWLRADQGVELDDRGHVRFWRDAVAAAKPSGPGAFPHHASQADESRRPLWAKEAIGGQPAVRFRGDGEFLHLAGQVVSSPEFSVIAVVSDKGGTAGPREVISNWHFRGRSTSSVFLGTRGDNGVRFTDAFGQAGQIERPAEPFVFSAVAGNDHALTFQGRQQLASAGKLSPRDLGAPYVIGTQGNYGSEWWNGDLAELLVYDRALGAEDRDAVWKYLERRYGLATQSPPDPQLLALASLCHVLLNTNEFIYVD
ncbi:MAG: DUF1549 domain-containing protein [Planctomycetales bacterium]|nr:DUF1549 domain-containing protein [Planctomycetales bacterium]